eukprot:111483-Chlamydomonas_euryale.AAC.2
MPILRNPSWEKNDLPTAFIVTPAPHKCRSAAPCVSLAGLLTSSTNGEDETSMSTENAPRPHLLSRPTCVQRAVHHPEAAPTQPSRRSSPWPAC